ncbi:hypothetical protein J1605_013616 [Eschrichtius robustus]|uniref:Peroxiredoxin C-terminal domain-containing protein n=1 Tax=Eschrichtius robustus TaxID=9764 RepID=A0AB34GJ58_ESCRO|nr:hypothetical protein J1605_013616 [Eschrichtius robustus]
MEAPQRLLATTSAPSWSRKLLLLRLLLFLLPAKALWGLEVEERPPTHEEECHFYASFLYTDKHGEVCPGGWKPGGETVIPDPARKLKYFDKLN